MKAVMMARACPPVKAPEIVNQVGSLAGGLLHVIAFRVTVRVLDLDHPYRLDQDVREQLNQAAPGRLCLVIGWTLPPGVFCSQQRDR